MERGVILRPSGPFTVYGAQRHVLSFTDTKINEPRLAAGQRWTSGEKLYLGAFGAAKERWDVEVYIVQVHRARLGRLSSRGG